MDVKEKIEEKESEAFKDLQTILQDYKCSVTQTEAGEHWDATITSPLGTVEYVELKRRNCRWEDYPTAMALKHSKARFLKEIQDRTGNKVVVVLLYPKSGCYVAKSLEEILAEKNVCWYKYKLTEMDDQSEEAMQLVYNITLKEEDKKYYQSI